MKSQLGFGIKNGFGIELKGSDEQGVHEVLLDGPHMNDGLDV